MPAHLVMSIIVERLRIPAWKVIQMEVMAAVLGEMVVAEVPMVRRPRMLIIAAAAEAAMAVTVAWAGMPGIQEPLMAVTAARPSPVRLHA